MNYIVFSAALTTGMLTLPIYAENRSTRFLYLLIVGRIIAAAVLGLAATDTLGVSVAVILVDGVYSIAYIYDLAAHLAEKRKLINSLLESAKQ